MAKMGEPSITQSNPARDNYLRGSESVDGSVRLVTRILGDKVRAKIEIRNDGVWNAGRMETGGSDAVFLGQNVSIGALGASLEIQSIDGVIRSIPLDIPITVLGTTTPRVLRATGVLDRVVVQPIFDTQKVGQKFGAAQITTFQGFVFIVYLKVGTVPASEEVTVRVFAGLTSDGALIYEKIYPASLFVANTEIQLVDNIDFGIFIGDEVFIQIETSADLSLLSNPAGNIWFAVDVQNYIYEEVISSPTGTDKFVFDRSGHITADRNGDLVLGDRPRTINGIFNT